MKIGGGLESAAGSRAAPRSAGSGLTYTVPMAGSASRFARAICIWCY